MSSNLGTVTAGTIKGTTISGNTISGGTISGTTISGTTISGGTISGTTIKGGYLEGATGTFTGTLTVGQLLGSNIIEVQRIITKESSEWTTQGSRKTFRVNINIATAPVDRFYTIMNSHISGFIPANTPQTINYQATYRPDSNEARPPSLALDNKITVVLMAVTSAKTITYSHP